MAAADEHPEELLIRFSVSAEFIVRTQTAVLSWEVENADSVTIEPGIGPVAPTGNQTVRPNASVMYTLTATGPAGTQTETVSLNVFPTPLLERLQVPSPTDIRLKALFVNIRESLPEAPKYTSTVKCNNIAPKFRELRTDRLPVTPTANDLSKALNIPARDLYASIGVSENRLRTAVFKRLERLFSHNARLGRIFQTIRKS